MENVRCEVESFNILVAEEGRLYVKTFVLDKNELVEICCDPINWVDFSAVPTMQTMFDSFGANSEV